MIHRHNKHNNFYMEYPDKKVKSKKVGRCPMCNKVFEHHTAKRIYCLKCKPDVMLTARNVYECYDCGVTIKKGDKYHVIPGTSTRVHTYKPKRRCVKCHKKWRKSTLVSKPTQ